MTPDGYKYWDQFARERDEAECYANRHPWLYPQTKQEILRDEYSPDNTATTENTDNDDE